MHLDTTGGTAISADYPFTLARLLAEVKGPQMLTVFSIGTAGDINHVDVSTKSQQHGPEEAQRIGTILAQDVLKTYAKLQPVATFAPRARSQIVPLALPDISKDDLQQARKTGVKLR